MEYIWVVNVVEICMLDCEGLYFVNDLDKLFLVTQYFTQYRSMF